MSPQHRFRFIRSGRTSAAGDLVLRYRSFPEAVTAFVASPHLLFSSGGLIRRKYSDAEIRGVLGGNFSRVLAQIWAGGLSDNKIFVFDIATDPAADVGDPEAWTRLVGSIARLDIAFLNAGTTTPVRQSRPGLASTGSMRAICPAAGRHCVVSVSVMFSPPRSDQGT